MAHETIRVQLSCRGVPLEGETLMRDVDGSGGFVETERPMPVGTVLELTPTGSPELRVPARVALVVEARKLARAVAGETPGMSLLFEAMGQKLLEHLELEGSTSYAPAPPSAEADEIRLQVSHRAGSSAAEPRVEGSDMAAAVTAAAERRRSAPAAPPPTAAEGEALESPFSTRPTLPMQALAEQPTSPMPPIAEQPTKPMLLVVDETSEAEGMQVVELVAEPQDEIAVGEAEGAESGSEETEEEPAEEGRDGEGGAEEGGEEKKKKKRRAKKTKRAKKK